MAGLVPVGLIWAQARGLDGRAIIGAAGGMPWHVPEDLAHFKRTTLGNPVVVGRRTWESFPPRFRPLPRRTTVVVTRQTDFAATGAGSGRSLVRGNVPDAIAAAREVASSTDADDAPDEPVVWIAGGAQLYAQALDVATIASVTELDLDVAGDTLAPVLGDDWRVVSTTPWAVSSSGVRYRMLDLRRD